MSTETTPAPLMPECTPRQAAEIIAAAIECRGKTLLAMELRAFADAMWGELPPAPSDGAASREGGEGHG